MDMHRFIEILHESPHLEVWLESHSLARGSSGLLSVTYLAHLNVRHKGVGLAGQKCENNEQGNL